MKTLFCGRYTEIAPKHDELFLSDCHHYIQRLESLEERRNLESVC